MSEVLLLGGSIPSLVAALELAKVGIKVRIAGDAEQMLQHAQLPQRPVRDPSGEVAELFDELAAPISAGAHPEPSIEVARQAPSQTWLQGRDAAFKPQPFPSYFGIPTTVPITTECVDMLGTGGAFRAYLDRVKPLLTIGKQENFAKLVESRIGRAARELLVELPIFERFGVSAAGIEVSIIAPGLNEALTRTGSLTGSTLQQLERHVARETTVVPADGWAALAARLIERLEMFGATKLDAAHISLVRVAHEAGDIEGRSDGAAEVAAWHGGWIMTDETGSTQHFDAIIVDDRISETVAIATKDASTGHAGIDPGIDSVANVNFGETLDMLSSGLYRIHAEIGIEAADAVLLGDGEHESLRALDDENGTPWAMRVRKADEGSDSPWTLRCSGPVVTTAELASSHNRFANLTEALKLRNPDVNARVWVEAAPCVTHDERDSQESKLTAWHGDWVDALACSEAFSGGELGAAIAQARAHATHLRRRLTGISE